MHTFDELESLWGEADPLPRDRGTVDLICARKGDGVHDVLELGTLSLDGGLTGDRWVDGKRRPGYQVTLMMTRVARWICADTLPLHTPGDNFLVDFDLGVESAPAGTRLRIGTALLEVTEHPHTGCKKFKERFGAARLRWINWKPGSDRQLRGINCRVVEAGEVRVGGIIERA